MAAAGGGLAGVLTSRLGDVGGRILLVAVAIAVFACSLPVQTSGSRMMSSMARERSLPLSGVLGRVSARTGTSIEVGVGAGIALAVSWNQSAVFTALAPLCIAMLHIAYLVVTLPRLVKRLRLRRTGGLEQGVAEDGNPLCSLGRSGIPINVAAVVQWRNRVRHGGAVRLTALPTSAEPWEATA